MKMKRKRPKRAKRQNRHHIVPKARGGANRLNNLIWLEKTKHAYWHKIFGLMTFKEAANLLLRADKMIRGKHEDFG